MVSWNEPADHSQHVHTKSIMYSSVLLRMFIHSLYTLDLFYLSSSTMFFTISIVELQCLYPGVNVSVFRTPHRNGTDVIKFFVTRNVSRFIPITVEIFRGDSEDHLANFRCENGSIPYGGANIGEVIFEGRCEHPTVTVSNTTVEISLDLHVILGDENQACSTINIGPQSEHTEQLNSVCNCLI